MRKRFLAGYLLLAACGAEPTERVGETQQPLVTSVAQHVGIPSSTQATVTATECQNSPGPFVTLDGLFALGGFNVELVFRNNVKGTHERVETGAVDVVVLQAGESITIPKQPVLGGVGGNPWIFVQLVDGNDQPISDEVLLGRCVQGLNNMNLAALAPAFAEAELTSLSCANSPGPYISVDGLLTMGGVKAKIIFRNNMKGTHETDVVTEITLMAEGTEFTFPKQPPLGGVGGNPHIYMRFTDGDGNVLGEETYLGRCKQLSKKL